MHSQGTDVRILKIIFAKKISVLGSKKLNYEKKLILTFFFRKTPFFAENCDHNIDPRLFVVLHIFTMLAHDRNFWLANSCLGQIILPIYTFSTQISLQKNCEGC
jgi:hypothetical protein